jgi:hypothetical protein
MQSVMQAIVDGRPFILAATRSAVLFDIKTLTAYWIGAQKATFQYTSLLEFQNGVSLQLLTHQKYIDPPAWLQIPTGLLPE